MPTRDSSEGGVRRTTPTCQPRIAHYPRSSSVITSMASEAYKNLVYVLHLQLCTLLSIVLALLLPKLVAASVALVYFAWITAMYSFEYRWAHGGVGFEARMSEMEVRWAYFMGFGMYKV